MQKIKLKDKEFAPYIGAEQIADRIAQLGEKISADYAGKSPVFLAVLNGSFMFAADLLREFKGDCHISFVKLASYHGTTSTGEVRELIGLNEDIREKDIIVIEDIVDTGLTVDKVVEALQRLSPASVRIATLLYKPNAYKGKSEIHYPAIEIPNDFIVGYGLDYDGLGRNLKDIYKIVE
ncbi:MAG: hypoxanthine phosphoribosyltransferase [Flavobacteriales bacterium]|nr:hypoxanthine phosphoribosyltransferase [Flavobacteriales bacterium]